MTTALLTTALLTTALLTTALLIAALVVHASLVSKLIVVPVARLVIATVVVPVARLVIATVVVPVAITGGNRRHALLFRPRLLRRFTARRLGRLELLGRHAAHAEERAHLEFGRIVVSEIEVPNMFVDLV